MKWWAVINSTLIIISIILLIIDQMVHPVITGISIAVSIYVAISSLYWEISHSTGSDKVCITDKFTDFSKEFNT